MTLLGAILAADPRILDDDGGWCWFQDERCIVHDGVLYVGSVSSGHVDPARHGDVNVIMHDLAANTTRIIELDDQLQLDDHDDPALLAGDDGVFAIWATHGGNWKIYSSTIKADGTATPKQTLPIKPADGYGVTYANLFRMPNGDLVNIFRGAGWDPNVIRSIDGGQTWSEPKRLLGGPGRPYVRYAQDSVGRIHVFATEQHPRNFDNSLFHGMLDGDRVLDSAGRQIGTLGTHPPAPEMLTQVFKGDADNVAWCSSIEVDVLDRPVVAYSVQKDSAGMKVGTGGADHRYRYARWNGSNWIDHEVGFAGTRLFAREDDYTGLISIVPSDPATVYFSTNAQPETGEPLVSTADEQRHWEIWRGDTADGGATWAFTPVTANSEADNLRPMVPPGSTMPVLVWLRGNYRTYTDYDQAVCGLVGEEIPAPGTGPAVPSHP